MTNGLIVLYLTVEAGVALWAGALVGPITVLAGAPVQARLGVAFVDVMLAVAAREARWTHAGEGVDAIHAGSPIKTGAGRRENRHCFQINTSDDCNGILPPRHSKPFYKHERIKSQHPSGWEVSAEMGKQRRGKLMCMAQDQISAQWQNWK